MATRKITPSLPELLAVAEGKVRFPLAVVLGSPREVAELASALPPGDVTCYQMDLYQAGRLQEDLAARKLDAQVQTATDLWDLPGGYKTLVYPVAKGGERSLKIDMIEQAFHVLEPSGNLLVLTPYEKDQFFPLALKKVFKRVHAPAAGNGMLLTCQRQGERPRRRHKITFQVQSEFGRSLRFLSRPGVFSYGRFDDGARALVEIMEIEPGARVLDLGCGCGTNGIFAGLRSGPEGFTMFVDSNVRAVALADFNARAQGLSRFEVVAASSPEALADESFDVVLANPPYYAQQSIAPMFIEHAWRLLRPGGRLYLVTKQPDVAASLVIEIFGDVEAGERRGYHVLCATRPRTHPHRKPLEIVP
jgi:23S rRNA (guanine1835-N2)-methyltransferase